MNPAGQGYADATTSLRTNVVLFRLSHYRGLRLGRDCWRVHSISYLQFALTQPFLSFFAPFLHFPVTGVSRLVG
jgi:hypothetical protein